MGNLMVFYAMPYREANLVVDTNAAKWKKTSFSTKIPGLNNQFDISKDTMTSQCAALLEQFLQFKWANLIQGLLAY